MANRYKDSFLKIWRDPVLSKIISVGIIALATLIYNLIVSKFENTDFRIVFVQFWTQKFDLWIFLIIIPIGLIIFVLQSYLKKNLQTDIQYDEELLNLDKALFNRIRNDLLTQDIMLAPRTYTFSSNSFPDASFHNIFEILYECRKSDFEFFDSRLDQLKSELIEEIEDFQTIAVEHIYGAGQTGWLGIPHEWDSERYNRSVNEVRSYEKSICDKYDELIKTGRRLLKI
jgi:hypothetical protein